MDILTNPQQINFLPQNLQHGLLTADRGHSDLQFGTDQSATIGDVDRGLHLVARDHPGLDVRTFQADDCFAHFVLKFVFNCSRPQKTQVLFQAMVEIFGMRFELRWGLF